MSPQWPAAAAGVAMIEIGHAAATAFLHQLPSFFILAIIKSGRPSGHPPGESARERLRHRMAISIFTPPSQGRSPRLALSVAADANYAALEVVIVFMRWVRTSTSTPRRSEQ